MRKKAARGVCLHATHCLARGRDACLLPSSRCGFCGGSCFHYGGPTTISRGRKDSISADAHVPEDTLPGCNDSWYHLVCLGWKPSCMISRKCLLQIWRLTSSWFPLFLRWFLDADATYTCPVSRNSPLLARVQDFFRGGCSSALTRFNHFPHEEVRLSRPRELLLLGSL
jgi:hypothetical protein